MRQSPRAVGSHARVWTTNWVRHFRSTRCGSESCRGRVRQRRHARGGRLRRLRPRPRKATPEAPAAFVAEVEWRLAAWPEDGEVICVDEATIRRHPP